MILLDINHPQQLQIDHQGIHMMRKKKKKRECTAGCEMMV
jgi:hypothetical protein